MYIVNNSEATKQLSFIAGAGGVSLGDLVVLTAGKVLPAATNATTIVGVAQSDALADEVVEVEVLENFTVEADYSGTFAEANLGTAFDLSDAQTVDQTASVNGDLILVGFNADTNKGRFVIPAASRLL